jgi:hypothetical protein
LDLGLAATPKSGRREKAPEERMETAPRAGDFLAAEQAAGRKVIHAAGRIWSEKEWPQFIRQQPLNKREVATLARIGSGEVGVVISRGDFKGAGPDTMARLEGRGYVIPNPREADRSPDYKLTTEGKEAWSKLAGMSQAPKL